jgi:hypothetical protein
MMPFCLTGRNRDEKNGTAGYLTIGRLSGHRIGSAKALVMKHHSGAVENVSVKKERNKYIVAWENEDNCEWGTDSVNKNGEVENLETAIC